MNLAFTGIRFCRNGERGRILFMNAKWIVEVLGKGFLKLVWRYRERDGVGETQELSKCKTDSETNSQMDERDRGLADVREKGRLSSLFFSTAWDRGLSARYFWIQTRSLIAFWWWVEHTPWHTNQRGICFPFRKSEISEI